MQTVNMIVACGEDGSIGKSNQLIWRLTNDLKRFKALTVGGVVIMGRKTYDSIGHPLPERLNIVISRQALTIPGCVVVDSIPAAIGYAHVNAPRSPIWVIGGGDIYRHSLEFTQTVYLTRINGACPEADTYFPLTELQAQFEEGTRISDESNGVLYRYETWMRKETSPCSSV